MEWTGMMGCRGLVGERGMRGFGWVSRLCARGLVGYTGGQQAQAGVPCAGESVDGGGQCNVVG